MDRSRFIASLLGPALAALGAAALVNRGLLPDMVAQLSGAYAVVLLAGLAVFVAGLAIVRSHEVWRGWPAIVTVMGWLCVAGGLARMLFPRQITESAAGMVVHAWAVPLAAGLMIVIGLFLAVMGWRRAA
jgi:hypothetical protein